MMRAALSSVVAALLVGVAAPPATAAEAAPVRMILGLAAGADPATVVDGIGPWHAIGGLSAITVDVPAAGVDAASARWGHDPAVRYLTPDVTLHADSLPPYDPYDPQDREVQSRFQVPGAWTWTMGSPSITVAVVDTGVTPNADLGADRLVPGYDFVDGDTDPADDDNHGTLVAGAIAAANNGVGATGVCPVCRVMPVRALRHSTVTGQPATGNSSDVAAGIVWAADHGAKIVNLSASTDVGIPLLQEAVDYAASKDVLVVASAGHSDPAVGPYIGYPAAFDNALAVGTAAINGAPSLDTNRNTANYRWIDVAGPQGYLGLDASGAMGKILGTSAGTAIVSGAAALAYAMKPNLTAASMRQEIAATGSQAPGQAPYDPPLLDVAHLVHDLGGTDTVAPMITDDLAVKDGMWLNKLIATAFFPVTSDDHAVARKEYLVNGQPVGVAYAYSSPVPLTNPAGLNGAYPVTTRVYDYAGNMAQRTVTVNFDSKPPVGKIDSPIAGLRVHAGAVKVVFSSPERDNIVNVVINGAATAYYPATNTWTATVAPVDGGKLIVQATDRGGNQTTWTRLVRVIP